MAKQDNTLQSPKETRINIAVPGDLHRRLKSLLALEGKTIRKWLIEEIQTTVESRENRKREGAQS